MIHLQGLCRPFFLAINNRQAPWRLFILIPILIPILMVFLGCASRYQAWDGKKGFFETEIDQRQQSTITFTGNNRTSKNRMTLHVLYRAAEVTIENGYDAFVIISCKTGSIPDFIMNRDCSGHINFQDNPTPVVEAIVRLYKTDQLEIPTEAVSASQFIQEQRQNLNSDNFDVDAFLESMMMR